MEHVWLKTGWLAAACAAMLAGCIYPVTTDQTTVATDAIPLPPAERSVVHLSSIPKGYILLYPEVSSLDWEFWRADYFPPGTIEVVPGSYTFQGGKFFMHCRFSAQLAPGHEYRPTRFDCRDYPNKTVTCPISQCLADNPGSNCCAALEDTAPDGTQTELAMPCDLQGGLTAPYPTTAELETPCDLPLPTKAVQDSK